MLFPCTWFRLFLLLLFFTGFNWWWRRRWWGRWIAWIWWRPRRATRFIT